MKLKIKVKILKPGCEPLVTEKGEWIDLRAAKTHTFRGPWAGYLNKGNKQRNVTFESFMMPLGVAIRLPKGFEAIVNTRSSIYKNFKVCLANNQGVIDNSYNSNEDQWFAQLIAFEDTIIEAGDRICQFRIQLSQKANIWQKLRWFFSNGVRVKLTQDLGGTKRGGFGSTGIK